MAPMQLFADDPEWMNRLTAEASPLNPIPVPVPDEPGGASSLQPIPAAESKSPERNPFVSPIDPYELLQKGPLGQAYRTAQQGATGLFNLAGKADVAAGIKDPETAASRAGVYGPLAVNAALGRALPTAASAGGNAILNALFGGGTAALEGSSPGEAAKAGGIMGAVGGGAEKIGQGLRYFGSAIPKKAFDLAQEAKITDWIKQRVPWWKDLDLSDMATSTKATDALKKGYEEAFTKARDLIPEDATASIPLEVAKTLKMKPQGGAGFTTAGGTPLPGAEDIRSILRQRGLLAPEANDTLAVNARELLDKLPGTEGATRSDILRGLEPIAGQVIPEARTAFKTGSGWLELANRGGIGQEGRFDAQTAQEALRKPSGEKSLAQDALGWRGMGPLEDIIKGPLKQPITSVTPNSLAWHLGLGGAGLLGGLGLHGLHGVVGAGAAAIPRPTFYRNVPPMMPQAGPLAQQGLRAVMPGFLGNMRSSDEPQRIEMTMTPEGPGR